MGVDLSVIIGHTLDADGAFELPARLSSSLPLRAAANQTEDPTATWQWGEPRFLTDPQIVSASSIRDEWARGHGVRLDGPGGFIWWDIGPRALYANHRSKFTGFVCEQYGLQMPVRRLCRAMAAALGSDRAIYLPDSGYRISAGADLVYRGGSFDEIASWLGELQPPSPTIGAIYDDGERGHSTDGYFIDDFADLDRVERFPTRQRAWSAREIAELTSALPRYLRETPSDDRDSWQGIFVQELVTWLASIGRYERAALAGLLNKNGLCPVPERLRPVFDCLERPEDERVVSLRATYSDPVPPLVELLDAMTRPEVCAQGVSGVHAAAIQALGDLGTDDAARGLVSLFPRLSGDGFRMVVDEALRRCGARIVEPVIDIWDQLAFYERRRLMEVLQRCHVRDERLRATLVASLAKDHPHDELGVIGACGDDGLVPDLHRFIDRRLETYADGGALYLATTAATAVRALGGALTAAQTQRLAAIIEELEARSDVADRELRKAAVSLLESV